MAFRVFIHTNDQQLLGAKVAAYSFKSRSKSPEQFDVELIQLKDHPHLLQQEGKSYRRKGVTVKWRNEDLQSFSPLRFLPPQIMNYEGRALITDPDVFAVGDIAELLTRDMGGKAILCRHIIEGKYTKRSPFYATSVMLLDCAKLKHWNWQRQIDGLFSQEFDYGDWVALKLENPDTIGELEEKWNSFDKLEGDTKLLHTTERITQPWKTGLPRDFNLTGERSIRLWLRQLEYRVRGPNYESGRFYRPHPDANQERYFLQLTKECLEQGVLSRDFVEQNMKRRFVRPDLLQKLESGGSHEARV